MEPSVALENLFNASKFAKLTAQEHEILNASYRTLRQLIMKKPEEVKTSECSAI